MSILKFLGLRKIVDAHYDKVAKILTVNYNDNSQELYYGEGAYWCHYPMMNACGILYTSELYDVWNYIETHGNPYPTAHKKLC